jgi:D-alanyl-D-alanine carboxypeptidase/D-alanyl-D-alanine-endopeptidase (penicillin-binding protein 4)
MRRIKNSKARIENPRPRGPGILYVLFLIGFAAVALAQAPPPPPAPLTELQQRLTEHLANPRFAAATWGVKVLSLDSGRTLFEQNAGKLFSPASNCKLYTMALALDHLGGDYRIKTSLYAAAKPDRRGVLPGDLIIYGRGDPTLNTRLHDGDIFHALEPLVAALTNAGVRRIRGDVVGDASFFHGPPYGSGWAWDDLNNYYGAEISALTINDNTLQLSVTPGLTGGSPCQLTLAPGTDYVKLSNRTQTVTPGNRRDLGYYRPLGQNVIYVTGQLPLGDTNYTGEVTMANPAGLFVALFKEALARRGIRVDGKTRVVNEFDPSVSGSDVSRLVELGSVSSPPMRDLVREVQKPSQNLYADLVLAHIGALAAATDRPVTSEGAGIRELEKFLAKVGVSPGDVQFEEGAGLSRNNLVTPNATIALLQFMSHHVEADAYLSALPIAGVDGSLRYRMTDPPAAANVRAKTGTLRWANALSGHVTTAAGEHLIFCVMLNRYAAPDAEHSGRAEIDRIAVMLSEFSERTDQ